MNKQAYPTTGLEIAVIGMSVRVPGAETLEAFWQNLKSSKDCITFFTDEQLLEAGIEQTLIDDPNYIKAKGIVADGMGFDYEMFGYSQREALMMDPQLRIYHECIQQALADACCQPDTFEGQIGLYGGIGSNPKWSTQFLVGGGKNAASLYETINLNGKEFFSTRVANKINLTGPAMTVQTACSSSLVAVHLAVQGLIAGDCDVALAGGVDMTTDSQIKVSDITGYVYQEGMIYAKDGHCRPFDRDANGTVPGDGAGIVVLKPLEDAINDGDSIYAVIKGSAINNDGSDKAGFTAPSVKGQVAVIEAAQEMAEVEPETISYVEAHGTGTPLGDPIEIGALTEVFANDEIGYCRVGSIKSNIGHLGAAAGIAGLIKTVLAIKHQQIPASLYYKAGNEEIDFENSPFKVNAQLHDWSKESAPLRAGVSSFGIGGTNSHVVLEEYIPQAGVEGQSSADDRHRMLTLSATSDEALERQCQQLGQYLSAKPTTHLDDIEYSLQSGRQHFAKRRVITGNNLAQLISGLTNNQADNHLHGTTKEQKVVFMFPGQGAQYQQMSAQLYHNHQGYREIVDGCFERIDGELQATLKDILFSTDQADNRINETQYTQPLLFIVEYSLANYLMELGLEPWGMIGHSIGEYVAATLSGVMDVKTALELVIQRGQLMASTAPGAMLAVQTDEQAVINSIPEGLNIAAVNTANGCVVAGSHELIDSYAKQCEAQSIKCKKLTTSHAYHSASMDSILAQFTAVVAAKVQEGALNPPTIPYVSNLTGDWISAEQTTDANYWAQHLRQSVRFADGLACLFERQDLLLIEVGPGKALATFARQHKDHSNANGLLSMLTNTAEKPDDIAAVVARLFLAGQAINWDYYHQDGLAVTTNRQMLPGHSFNRSQFLPTPITLSNNDGITVDDTARLFVPNWLRGKSRHSNINSVLQTEAITQSQSWLIFLDELGYGLQLAEVLRAQGKRVITVVGGDSYQRLENDHYSVKLSQANDYIVLFEELIRLTAVPEHMVHLLNISDPAQNKDHQAQLDLSFYSLIYLAQAIGQVGVKKPLRLCVGSNDVQSVSGLETINAEKSTLLGAVRVINQEYANIACHNVDLVVDNNKVNVQKQLLLPILAELSAEQLTQLVAYRGEYRWTREFSLDSPVKAPEAQSTMLAERLLDSGHYLITGGLGGIGLALAQGIANQVKARFTLLSRQGLPDQSLWSKWLAEHDNTNATSIKINAVLALQQQGCEVFVAKVDVVDCDQLITGVEVAEAKFGPVHGVIHAAGVPGGGAIQMKDRATADNVLAAKIAGTQNLAKAVANSNPNFVCLCSSITSVIGGFGQVDYSAANAYLDACIHSGLFASSDLVFSINWDPWKEVGMAVNTARDGMLAYSTKLHPLLGVMNAQGEGHYSFKTRFATDEQWVLSEHKIFDQPTVPGTAYIEMARAAFSHISDGGAAEFNDIYFLAPLVVREGEWFEVSTELTKKNDSYQFVISSKPFGKGTSVEHARGLVAAVTTKMAAVKPIAEVTKACDQLITDDPQKAIREVIEAGQQDSHATNAADISTVDCGPRWEVFNHLSVGNRQGVLKLVLPQEYHAETDIYQLHPAVLDCATAFLSPFIKNAFFIPLFYRNIRQYRPLTPVCYSHVTEATNAYEEKDTVSYDVTIYDEAGEVLVQVNGFSMRLIASASDDDVNTKMVDDTAKVAAQEAVEWVKQGLLNHEGIDAFLQILTQSNRQVVVTKSDFNADVSRYQEFDIANLRNDNDSNELKERPELNNAYVSAKTESEKKLAGLWQSMLSLNKVGIHDDFFELGGDSLMLMQIHAQLAENFDKEIPIADLYNYPTIKKLAASLDTKEGEPDVELTKAGQRAERMKLAMRNRKGRPRAR